MNNYNNKLKKYLFKTVLKNLESQKRSMKIINGTATSAKITLEQKSKWIFLKHLQF